MDSYLQKQMIITGLLGLVHPSSYLARDGDWPPIRDSAMDRTKKLEQFHGRAF